MIELNQNDASYLDICKHYRAISDTQVVKDDEERHTQTLQCIVVYIILAPYDGHQADLLTIINQDKALENIQPYK